MAREVNLEVTAAPVAAATPSADKSGSSTRLVPDSPVASHPAERSLLGNECPLGTHRPRPSSPLRSCPLGWLCDCPRTPALPHSHTPSLPAAPQILLPHSARVAARFFN